MTSAIFQPDGKVEVPSEQLIISVIGPSITCRQVASTHIKRVEVLLPVAVCRSKTPELKSNFIRGNENVTNSAQSEFYGQNGFFEGNFLFRISE